MTDLTDRVPPAVVMGSKRLEKMFLLLLFLSGRVVGRLLPDCTQDLIEVAYEPEVNQIYLGSPSIIRVRSTGTLLLSADRFGSGSGTESGPRNVSIHAPVTNRASPSSPPSSLSSSSLLKEEEEDDDEGEDEAEDWELTGWVPDQYWSSLFQLEAAADADVFLLGTSTDGPAPLKIARSRDGGATWLADDAAVIAGEVRGELSFETGPTAVVEHGGRLYRAIERLASPLFRWGVDYQAVVASAPLVDCDQTGATAATTRNINNSNNKRKKGGSSNGSSNNASCIDALTDPSSWTLSPPLPFNSSWLESPDDDELPPPPTAPGFLEGNMVLGPDGATLYNLLRMDDTANTLPNLWGNKAILLRYDPPPVNVLSFDSVVDLPGGHSKFVVRRDPVTGLYVTLSNPTLNESYTDQRNVLVLCSSPDLRSWTIAGEGVGEGGRVGHDGGGGGGRGVLLLDDSGLALSPDDSVAFTGFHYVDWQFDGGSSGSDDIVMAVRTAYRGAVSYHNSNRITTKVIKNWRGLL